MRRIRLHRGGGSRGQALAEFALILPVFMLLTLGVLDGARVFTAQVALTNAAREAAIFASESLGYLKWCRDASGGGSSPSVPCPAGTTSVRYTEDPTNIAARVRGEITGLNPALVTVLPPLCDGATCSEASSSAVNVRIRLSYPMPLLTPVLGAIWGSPVTITAETTARIFR